MTTRTPGRDWTRKERERSRHETKILVRAMTDEELVRARTSLAVSESEQVMTAEIAIERRARGLTVEP
jgi:hypothetical protein